MKGKVSRGRNKELPDPLKVLSRTISYLLVIVSKVDGKSCSQADWWEVAVYTKSAFPN